MFPPEQSDREIRRKPGIQDQLYVGRVRDHTGQRRPVCPRGRKTGAGGAEKRDHAPPGRDPQTGGCERQCNRGLQRTGGTPYLPGCPARRPGDGGEDLA